MFSCVLCKKETCIVCNLCPKCERISHLISVYDDRVYDVLEKVLVRGERGLTAKTKNELTAEAKTLNEDISKCENPLE